MSSETTMFLQAILIAFCVAGSHGAIHFASYYQSHMVLQRGPSQAVIWGHATKIGDTVTVTLSGHGSVTGHVTADAKGRGTWKVKLPAVTDVHPLSVMANSSEGVVSISDILFGDVWLCSGQSNMEFTVNQAVNHTSELSSLHLYPDIRVMRVRNTKGSIPVTELYSNGIQTSWTKPNAGSVRGFSAVCWYFGKYLHEDRKYPIGLIETNWGGTPIEAWSSPDALRACSNRTKRGPADHSVLWNTMINPLLGLTIYGAIWYQGEGNAGSQASRYACQFPAMIEDWREKFHRASLGQTSTKFPFGFVQLDAFRTNVNYIGGFPIIRLGQTANHGTVPNVDMKNTFMSVAMDLPDFKSPYGSIHPRDKQDVAQRLVLGARAVAYGETGVKFQGPYPRSISNNVGRHMVAVTYSYGPVDVRQKHGFEVCCSVHQNCRHGQHTWVDAPVVSHKGDIVYLNSSKCDDKNSVGVRYAYRESPCAFKNCAIYGTNTSLPGPPFLHLSGFGSGTAIIG